MHGRIHSRLVAVLVEVRSTSSPPYIHTYIYVYLPNEFYKMVRLGNLVLLWTSSMAEIAEKSIRNPHSSSFKHYLIVKTHIYKFAYQQRLVNT